MEKSEIRKKGPELSGGEMLHGFQDRYKERFQTLGAEKAAKRLGVVPLYREDTHVKVNPNSPQHPLRKK